MTIQLKSRSLRECSVCTKPLEELPYSFTAISLPEEIIDIFIEDIRNRQIFRLCTTCAHSIINIFVMNIDNEKLPLYINYNEFKNIDKVVKYSLETKIKLNSKIFILGLPLAGDDAKYLNNKIQEIVISRIRCGY